MQSHGSFSMFNVFLLIVLNLSTYFSCAFAGDAKPVASKWIIEERSNMTTSSNQMNNISTSHELNVPITDRNATTQIVRTKRQSGGGKYADAAKMPQVKILRLWLQLFANAWSNVYVGGAHPLHHNIPKPVVFLFKQRIGEFLFPKLEADEAAS